MSVGPWPEGTRNTHSIRWQIESAREGQFYGVFRDWSLFDGLLAFDWHCGDAETAGWLAAQPRRPLAPAPAGPSTLAEILANAREAVGLSRPKLADAAEVSADSVYAYEAGRRTPKRDALLRICRALALDGYTTNRALDLAGHPPVPSDFARYACGEEPVAALSGHIPVYASTSTMDRKRAETDSWPWPAFILNGRCDVAWANPLANRLTGWARWEALPGREALHLLQIAVSRQMREQVRNWDEVVRVMLPNHLEPLVLGAREDDRRAGLSDVARALRRQDPEGIERLLAAWSAAPAPPRRQRVAVKLDWVTPDGTKLAFHCLISGWNGYDPVWAMDWHPANAKTFEYLGIG
jgi:transcriptional regulator with XRE-family HTH domain